MTDRSTKIKLTLKNALVRIWWTLVTSVYLCVIKEEMIVFKAYLGQAGTSDSIRALLARGDLVPIDSWAEVGLSYEKYDTDDFRRSWDKIAKAPEGLQNLAKVPAEGTWGVLYES
jgi:hypothetical protein